MKFVSTQHSTQITAWIFSDILVANEVPSTELVPTVPRFEPGTSGFQSEDDTTTQKGLTRKCGRITSATTTYMSRRL